MALYFTLSAGLANANSTSINSIIKDPAFAQCISQSLKKTNTTEFYALTSLKCHAQGIENIEGINHFKELTSLSLFNNKIKQLTKLDLPKLKQLNLARNQLEKIELSNLPELEQLYLFDNRLQFLALRNLPKLQQLKANKNKISHCEFEALPALAKVYMFDNKMETIGFELLPALKYMDVRQNPMPDELYERMDQVSSTTFLHDGNAEDWQ